MKKEELAKPEKGAAEAGSMPNQAERNALEFSCGLWFCPEHDAVLCY